MVKIKKYKFHYDNKEIGEIYAYSCNEAMARAEMIAKRLGDDKPFTVKIVERIL